MRLREGVDAVSLAGLLSVVPGRHIPEMLQPFDLGCHRHAVGGTQLAVDSSGVLDNAGGGAFFLRLRGRITQASDRLRLCLKTVTHRRVPPVSFSAVWAIFQIREVLEQLPAEVGDLADGETLLLLAPNLRLPWARQVVVEQQLVQKLDAVRLPGWGEIRIVRLH